MVAVVGLLLDNWLLASVGVIALCISVVFNLARVNLLHPLVVYFSFSSFIVVLSAYWVSTYLNAGDVARHRLIFPVGVEHVFSMLFLQQLMLISMGYLGYEMSNRLMLRKLDIEPVLSRIPGMDLIARYWYLPYLIGFVSMAFILFPVTSVEELVHSMKRRAQRAEGNGHLILLSYFAYIGALLWYKKNINASHYIRVIGLIVLISPLAMYGSRIGILIILFAVLYIEIYLKRMTYMKLLYVGLLAFLFMLIYQNIRAGRAFQDWDIMRTVFKDLAMGVGYLKAQQYELLGNGFNMDIYVRPFLPFIPGTIKQMIGMPPSPNEVYSLVAFPGVRSTFSMGVWGEAGYAWPSFYYVTHYFIIGIVFSLVSNWREKFILFPAIASGAALRVVKGGYSQGFANLMLFFLPLCLIYIVAVMVLQYSKRQA